MGDGRAKKIPVSAKETGKPCFHLKGTGLLIH